MILADENVVSAVVARLRADGFDVVWIAEVEPSANDLTVLERAASQRRVLLTDDKDFGELVVREGRAHRGVVLLRLAGMATEERADLVSRLFATEGLNLADAFTVVEADGRVRVRRVVATPRE